MPTRLSELVLASLLSVSTTMYGVGGLPQPISQARSSTVIPQLPSVYGSHRALQLIHEPSHFFLVAPFMALAATR